MGKKGAVVRKPRVRTASVGGKGIIVRPSVAPKAPHVSGQTVQPQPARDVPRFPPAVRWVGTGQLALRCCVSTQTIRNDIERGKIIARQTGAGRYVIPRAEAERYMSENGYAENPDIRRE